jgi:hypothetical protein
MEDCGEWQGRPGPDSAPGRRHIGLWIGNPGTRARAPSPGLTATLSRSRGRGSDCDTPNWQGSNPFERGDNRGEGLGGVANKSPQY